MRTKWQEVFELGWQVGCNPRFQMYIVLELTDIFNKVINIY